MNEEDRVYAARDDGRKHQWAIGKLFYCREGGKRKLNTKSLIATTSLVFIVISIALLFLDSPKKSAEINTSDVQVPTTFGKEDPTVSIDAHIGTFDKKDAPRKGDQHKRQVIPPSTSYSGLAKVERTEKLQIPPGSLVKAKLSSGASNGPVRAHLLEELLVAGQVLLKTSTLILGKGSSTPERLMIEFSDLVFDDGSSRKITAQACDHSDKMPGLVGSNARSQALRLGGAIGLGLVGGTAVGLQNRQNSLSNQNPTMKDALLNGVGVASLEQARSLTSDIKGTQPLIQVTEGTEFYVLFEGESK